jgi:hypothetical protein
MADPLDRGLRLGGAGGGAVEVSVEAVVDRLVDRLDDPEVFRLGDGAERRFGRVLGVGRGPAELDERDRSVGVVAERERLDRLVDVVGYVALLLALP